MNEKIESMRRIAKWLHDQTEAGNVKAMAIAFVTHQPTEGISGPFMGSVTAPPGPANFELLGALGLLFRQVEEEIVCHLHLVSPGRRHANLAIVYPAPDPSPPPASDESPPEDGGAA